MVYTVDSGKKKYSAREEEKKMEREREVCLWLVTRSREEIPSCAHTYTHTQVQKHREQRHVRENKDLLCTGYRFVVYVCAFVHGWVCVSVCVCVCVLG